jgi:hypothetical protein
LSEPNSKPERAQAGPLYRKPRADIFTMLLVLALLAILVGIMALYGIMKEYEVELEPARSRSLRGRSAPCRSGYLMSRFSRESSETMAMRVTMSDVANGR